MLFVVWRGEKRGGRSRISDFSACNEGGGSVNEVELCSGISLSGSVSHKREGRFKFQINNSHLSNT
jgi:hypothetical protein